MARHHFALKEHPMEPVVIFAIAGCLLSAGVMYVVLDYRHYGTRQNASNTLLGVQTELAVLQKKLSGYTKYGDYLSGGQQALTSQMKIFTARVMREYVHIENIPKDTLKLKSDATIIIRYSVDYTFSINLSPENFTLVATTAGLDLTLGRPALVGAPVVKALSFEIPTVGVLPDDKAAVADAQKKLPELAQRYSSAVAAEETTRALCAQKISNFLRDFLTTQPGVRHLPLISVIFK